MRSEAFLFRHETLETSLRGSTNFLGQHLHKETKVTKKSSLSKDGNYAQVDLGQRLPFKRSEVFLGLHLTYPVMFQKDIFLGETEQKLIFVAFANSMADFKHRCKVIEWPG